MRGVCSRILKGKEDEMAKDASGWVEEMLAGIGSDPWTEGDNTPNPHLAFSEVLGRRVPTGDCQDQKVAPYEKARQALEAGQFRDAAVFIDFFVDEADVIYTIFRQLVPD